MTATRPRTIRIAPAASLLAPKARLQTAADYLLAGLMMLPAVPLMMFAMLTMKLTSRGPAIYTQTRLGRNGVPFTIFKIRTMIVDAEDLTGPRWSLPGDPRITRVGRVLRKLHLDELPQLWNVLRGEMSLVGPRPERPEIAVKLRKAIPGYDRRLLVKPGITGYAQIHLPPDETLEDVRRKLAYDLEGIRCASLRLYLTILARTLLKVVGMKTPKPMP